MNDFSTKNLFWGVKMIAVTLMILIAIATNVEIWNMFAANVTDLFHLVVSIINFKYNFFSTSSETRTHTDISVQGILLTTIAFTIQ